MHVAFRSALIASLSAALCLTAGCGGTGSSGSGGGKGGGSASSGGGSGTSGGGSGSSGGGSASSGGGSASSGGGSASSGGGSASSGGGTSSSGGGTSSSGGGTSSSGGGTSSSGGGTSGASAQIAAARTEADLDAGTASSPKVIQGALVTYLKPFVGSGTSADPSGFFLQADPAGPAIFVAVDPAAVDGGPVAVGDMVSLTATSLGRSSGGIRTIWAVSGLSKSSAGNPVTSLRTSASTTDFGLVANVDAFESRLETVSGTLVGTPAGAGAGFVSSTMTTAGSATASSMALRLPEAVFDSLDLASGCAFSQNGVTWRNNVVAQPSSFTTGEVTVSSCPAPKLLNAVALSPTRVRARFDRKMASPPAGGLTISGNVSVSSASASVRELDIVTTGQDAGATYTLTAGSTVTDTRSTPVSSSANTATFTGFQCGAAAVVISQVYSSGGNAGATYSNDFVELHNRSSSAVDISTWSVQTASSAGTTWTRTNLTGSIPAGGFYLVQMAASTSCAGATACGQALPAPNATGTSALATGSGKVVLLSTQTTIASGTACPAANAVDIVGYGAGTNCVETSPASGPVTSAQAISRAEGCLDVGNNALDFTITAPTPHNGASAAATCACP